MGRASACWLLSLVTTVEASIGDGWVGGGTNAPNGCSFSLDDVCDEPDTCDPGTDCEDCGNTHENCVPTASPTATPTASPSLMPTLIPTHYPSLAPTAEPTSEPSKHPTSAPTMTPTEIPTLQPTIQPSHSPTDTPTPRRAPTRTPTYKLSFAPTAGPTLQPTAQPSSSPTGTPTTEAPTKNPTPTPTSTPTPPPTAIPTRFPTLSPTRVPTTQPTQFPSSPPTTSPTADPTVLAQGHSNVDADGCAYAKDGFCDEPDYCTGGTDCTDCVHAHSSCPSYVAPLTPSTTAPSPAPTQTPTLVPTGSQSPDYLVNRTVLFTTELAGFTLATFDATAQTAIRQSFSDWAEVEISAVHLLNIIEKSSRQRRLVTGGVEFDVAIETGAQGALVVNSIDRLQNSTDGLEHFITQNLGTSAPPSFSIAVGASILETLPPTMAPTSAVVGGGASADDAAAGPTGMSSMGGTAKTLLVFVSTVMGLAVLIFIYQCVKGCGYVPNEDSDVDMLTHGHTHGKQHNRQLVKDPAKDEYIGQTGRYISGAEAYSIDGAETYTINGNPSEVRILI